jgi:hypothetical protein
VPAQRAYGRVRNRRERRVDAPAEEEPVGAEEQQRIDLLAAELLASRRRRRENAEPHSCVERLRRPLQRLVEPGRRRRRDGDAIRGLRRQRAAERGRAADEEEQDHSRDEEDAASQPLADLALRNERDRAEIAHRPTSSRNRSASDGGP